MASLREQLFLADKKLKEAPSKLYIPEWLVDVYVRHISAKDIDTWLAANQAKETNYRARLIVLALCDEQGNLLYKPEEANVVGEFSSVVLDILWERVCEINIIREIDSKKKPPSVATEDLSSD